MISRNITSCLAPLVVALGCARPCEPTALDASRTAHEPADQAIASVLDAFHAAAGRADEQTYFALLADDAVFLGTDATERWNKETFRAYAHPHFARGKAWRFRSVRRTLAFDTTRRLAWFEEELATQNLGPARGSGVLALRGGRWLIVQYNLALTIPNDRFDSVKEAASAKVTPVQTTGPLAPLAWLAGAWVTERPNGERVEEHWTSPDGGTMLGSGRSVLGGRTTFFEHLRVESRDDRLVYVAQPYGALATEFSAVAASPAGVSFENLGHDWPKRISYTKVPEGVRVRAEGAPGERVEEYTLTPAVIPRKSPRSGD